jgi:mevalonate kinase
LSLGELSEYFQFNQFDEDLQKGLYFLSSIPQGYGLGSSGALCAAIASKYGNEKLKSLNYLELKDLFSKMESFFHGKSSGIDPLVIYVNSPLQINNKEVNKVNLKWDLIRENNLSIFLIDTQTVGETEPLVSWFKDNLSTDSYKAEIQEYQNLLQPTIDSFISFDIKKFRNKIKKLSEIQLKLFSPMIPSHIKPIWENGIQTDNFSLKLCGSGGGGLMLGFSWLNKDELTAIMRNNNSKHTYITKF